MTPAATPSTVKRGRGRPTVGARVHFHLPADLLADIDAEAERRGTTRAEEIRRRCEALRR